MVDNPDGRNPAYRHLSPRLSQLLYCVTVLEQQQKLATRENLASMMQVSANNVSFLLNQLRSSSENYLQTFPSQGGLNELANIRRKPGRSKNNYYLNVEQTITVAETARLALDALSLSRETGTLSVVKLMNHMTSRYGLSRTFVRERLDFCLNSGYLILLKNQPVIVPHPSGRIMAEAGYLELLAHACKPKPKPDGKPKAKSDGKRRRKPRRKK